MYIVERLRVEEERHEVLAVLRPEGGGEAERVRLTVPDCDSLGLAEGTLLSEEAHDALLAAGEKLACVQKAFALLSYGDYSSRRLTEKLRRYFPPAVCERTVSLLAERGYVDDDRLAARYAKSYAELRSYGPMRIRRELFGKGFSADVIARAVEPYEEEDHSERIAELLERKYPSADFSDPATRRKASDFLRRSGYGWEEISAYFREGF